MGLVALRGESGGAGGREAEEGGQTERLCVLQPSWKLRVRGGGAVERARLEATRWPHALRNDTCEQRRGHSTLTFLQLAGRALSLNVQRTRHLSFSSTPVRCSPSPCATYGFSGKPLKSGASHLGYARRMKPPRGPGTPYFLPPRPL